MRFFEIWQAAMLLESKIPSTTYGFWITPDGELISVMYEETHKRVLHDRFRLAMREAFEKGWIRVISHRRNGAASISLDIEVDPTALTKKNLRALRDLAASGGYQNFGIDTAGGLNGRYLHDISVAEFIKGLEELAASTR